MRLHSVLKSSVNERIGFVLLATLVFGLLWLFHSSASKAVNTLTRHGQAADVADGVPEPSPTPCCNDKPHLLVASYYSVKNGLTAKLLLNNKGPDPDTFGDIRGPQL